MAGNELIVSGPTWVAMKEQAAMLVRSGFLPDSIKSPEQAIAIALKGHEIGMPMMQAFSNIHVIKGKPTISAEGMNALIRKNCPKAKLEVLKNDASICTIKATRPGEAPFTYTYTIEDAKRAGITGNPSWSKYPDAMLFSRCISTVARRIFPDCLQGISYTPEDLGGEINEHGEIVSIIDDSVSIKPAVKIHDEIETVIPPKEDPKPPFDPNKPAHVASLTKMILDRDPLIDHGDIKIILNAMVGKHSTELDNVIKELGG